MSVLSLELPRKHRDALMATETPAGKPVRWRGLKGGRDSAKSWSNAKMALARGVAKPERILYVRETQKSLADSAHQLLCDMIRSMGLQEYYTPQKQYIIGSNGTQISFNGLSNETADSLKSKEGTTICVIQEAQNISARSLDILIPTIRAPGSELWAEWNPAQETDAIDQRLVANCPDDAIVAHVNYTDNPWASKALDSDRETMQRTDPAKFAHVYLGQYLPAVEGAIYYTEVAALRASGRLCSVPYDPMLKVHVIVDLGYNDFMSLIFVQRLMSEIRIIRYIEDRKRTVPSYSQEMRELRYNYGKVWLPHDGFATTLAASSNTLGTTVDEQFRNLGWETERIPNISVEQGIRKTREIFPRCAYDKTHAVELLNRLGRYRRRVDANGQAHAPVHDDQSHGSDGKRYVSLVADQLTNDAGPVIPEDPYAEFRSRAYG